MSFLKNLTHTGVSFTRSKSERRNIILTNYIALIAAIGNVLLVLGRLVYGYGSVYVAQHLLTGSAIFLLPILLNYFGFINLSRIALCWIPTSFVFYGLLVIIEMAPVQESSTYTGIRYFMLATSCFPFLVFDLRTRNLLIISLTVPWFLIIFMDPMLDALQMGYRQMGLNEPNYYFNNVRAVVSMIVVTASFLFLKRLNEKSEDLNDRLIANLANRNKEIQLQAEHKLYQLNQQLKENLDQLHEREFILNESQRVARVGSWEYRVKDRFLFWSEEMYNIFELDSQYKITPDTLTEFLLENHRIILNSAISKLLTAGEPLDFTVQARTPLGHLKWLRIYAYPVAEGSRPIGARGICHDVSYYKEAEERMRVSESKYRTLFEQASDSISITDMDGNFKDMNASFIDMVGYSKSELLHMNIRQILDPNELIEKPLPSEQLILGEEVFNERRLIHKNGNIRIVETNLKKIGPDTVMAMSRDTTELRKAQREIQLSEARFRSAFEYSGIGMTLVGLQGQWLKVNKEFCNITGFTENELLMMDYQEMTHPDDLSTDFRVMRNMIEENNENVRVNKRYFHKKGHVIWVNLNISLVRDIHDKPLYFVTQIEDITERKRIEQEKEKAHYDLNERIKELTTLYKTSQILHDGRKPTHEVLQEIVEQLPSGWQHTEVCAARITVGNDIFQTSLFSESGQRQRATFPTNTEAAGTVEVVYIEDRPLEVEGPFLAEERNLINMISEMLRVYFIQKRDAELRSRSEANLIATINNTETMIWSVDRNLNLLTFNRQFYDYALHHYGLHLAPGINHTILKDSIKSKEIAARALNVWSNYYKRVLTGEMINVQSEVFGRFFTFSLSPIIENKDIIGVSVFANDITDQKMKEQQLAEANKKIGELKLMALRSVMSPHFIFNVLNSIQYFIAKNDRVNAINYLSTFSKLIRNVLTHSVDNRIKLSDELELLKNYVMLELTRFENKFDFYLHVDPDIDVESITIPSLLIQPYVENAILHGLYNKMDKGKLNINVSMEGEEKVLFEIHDNGIGRAAAQKLKSQNFSSHKSMGINLTEERLRLITQSNETAVQIEDLESNGVALGTKVRIRIRCEAD